MFLTARITWYASDKYGICFQSLITVIDGGGGGGQRLTYHFCVGNTGTHLFCLNAERFLGPQKTMRKKEMDKLGYVNIRKSKL